MGERPAVPDSLAERFRTIAATLPRCAEEDAWVGVRWRVGKATVAHLFGGEDGQFRVTLRGDPDEVVAFQHLGAPYFKAGWGSNVIGLVLDEDTDWAEVAELVTASYCIMAPTHLAAQVEARLTSLGLAAAPQPEEKPERDPGGQELTDRMRPPDA